MHIRQLWMIEKEGLLIGHMEVVKTLIKVAKIVINIMVMIRTAFKEVSGFINAGRYQDALNILGQIRTRNSMWFYYSAIAENGVGNNVTAFEYAQTAVQMEPNNLQYLLLLQQLKGGQRQYQSGQQSYDSPFGDMSLCYNILLCSCLLNCCC